MPTLIVHSGGELNDVDARTRTSGHTPKRLSAYLNAIPDDGVVWLTEAGGLHNPANSLTAQGLDEAFPMDNVAGVSSRVTRYYHYAFYQDPTFDSGLLNTTGSERPAYDALQERSNP